MVNNGGSVQVLAIDIAGAFDKASHFGLLRKLEIAGGSGVLLKWFRSYLDSRRISCVVYGKGSSSYPIKAGVPQGRCWDQHFS